MSELAAAARAVDGALAQARALGVPVTITVVDDGGNLKAMRRMNGAGVVIGGLGVAGP